MSNDRTKVAQLESELKVLKNIAKRSKTLVDGDVGNSDDQAVSDDDNDHEFPMSMYDCISDMSSVIECARYFYKRFVRFIITSTTIKKPINSKNQNIADIEDKISNLKTKLNKSYGENNIYYHLIGNCISTTIDDFDYQYCAMSEVKQFIHNRGVHVSLGLAFVLYSNFQRFEGDVAIFNSGTACYNGSTRSSKVLFVLKRFF